MSNKGIYLHDIPFWMFIKYFFSGSYESDYISDRYSKSLIGATASSYYAQTYELSYKTYDSSGNETSVSTSVSLSMVGDVDVSKYSTSSVRSMLGIDLGSYQSPSITLSASVATSSDTALEIYDIGTSQKGFAPAGGLSLYRYYSVIEGTARYAVTKDSNGIYKANGSDLLSSGMTVGSDLYDDAEKPLTGKKYRIVYRSGKSVGRIYECRQAKIQDVDENGNLGFMDAYAGKEVFFAEGKEPKSPIEKYNDYMRELKSSQNKAGSPSYGDLYLIQRDGSYSLEYAETETECCYYVSNIKGTAMRGTLSLTNSENQSLRNWRPGASDSINCIRPITAGEAIPSSIKTPVYDAVISTADVEARKAFECSLPKAMVYSDSGIPAKMTASGTIAVSKLKAFLQEHAASAEITTSDFLRSCERSGAFVKNGSSVAYRDGYYETCVRTTVKISSAASILSKLTSDSMTVKDLISAFVSLGLFYGVSGKAIGSDALKSAYLDSASKIVSSVMTSSGNCYSGAYVGTDYAKSLYLYSKGMGEACSSILGYDLAENKGTVYESSESGDIQSGFVRLKDLRTRISVRTSDSPESEGTAGSSASEAGMAVFLSKAEGDTASLSSLRRVHDYESFELNSKRSVSEAERSASESAISDSGIEDWKAYVPEPSDADSGKKSTDVSLTKDALCGLVAQYAYNCGSSQSSSSRLPFFSGDYSEREYESKISSSSDPEDDMSNYGTVVYSFGSDPAANLAVFKSAILNKTRRNN